MSLKQACVDDLKFSHAMLVKAVSDFPADKLTFQNSPADNHVMWTLGHMCTAYSWFKSLFDGTMATLPDSYNGSFGQESKPVTDITKYPPFADVRKQFDATFEAMLAAIEKSPEADMLNPTAAESHGFAPTKLAALNRATWHEGWHAGQISTIRRALGMKSIF